MLEKRDVSFVVLQAALTILASFFLWYKILLPTTYYLFAILITAVIAIAVVMQSRFIILQIALLVLFTNGIFYISTNFNIIPFGDGNWDYAVVRTFIEQGRIFVIPSVNILSWYSGWPILHSLSVALSETSGIDAFHVSMLLPLVMSFASFLFVCVIVRRLRVSLGLDKRMEYFALLIYAASAEALFWQLQPVRQNLGLTMFFASIAMLSMSVTSSKRSCTYEGLAMFFPIVLVLTHHFTSFVLVFFLFSILLFQKLAKRANGAISDLPKTVTLGTAVLISVLLFSWWDSFGEAIWPTISSTSTRFRELFLGIRSFEYVPKPAYYPTALTPTWATSLLIVRDVLTYVPALLGLLVILVWKPRMRGSTSGFVIFSSLAFGLLFVVDNFLLRVEVFRTFEIALPFVAVLGGLFLVRLQKRLSSMRKSILIASFIFPLVFGSFVGLWGHSFAPIHLYDPSIAFNEVGERSTDCFRVSDFMHQNVEAGSYQTIWADDYAPLLRLLAPDAYPKISRLNSTYMQRRAVAGELVCEFKDLNLYAYYGREYSPIKTPSDGKMVSNELYAYLENYTNRIYDDGTYRLWTSLE